MFAYNHPFVGLHIRLNKECTALLQTVNRVRHGTTVAHRNHHTILASWNFSFVRLIMGKLTCYYRFATANCKRTAAQTDQAAGWNHKLKLLTGSAAFHTAEFATPLPHQFNNLTGIFVRNINRKPFYRLISNSVDIFEDNMRFSYAKFISFTTHIFNQN